MPKDLNIKQNQTIMAIQLFSTIMTSSTIRIPTEKIPFTSTKFMAELKTKPDSNIYQHIVEDNNIAQETEKGFLVLQMTRFGLICGL